MWYNAQLGDAGYSQKKTVIKLNDKFILDQLIPGEDIKKEKIKKIKITLDTGCIDIKENQLLDKILNLEKESKIEINISNAFIHDVLKGKEGVDQLSINDQYSACKRLSI